MLYINDNLITKEMLRDHPVRSLSWITEPSALRIAVCTEDAASWLAFYFYMKERNGSVLPIHPATPFEGAREMAERADCHVLIHHEWESPHFLSRTDREHEGVLIQMSSGTTGAPKVITRTWASIEEELEAYVRAFPLADETPSIVACPVTHSYGLLCGVMATLKRGGTPVVLTNLNPKYVLKMMAGFDRSLLYAGPALVHTVTQLAKEPLHAVMISGTLMPSAWFERLRHVSRHVLQQYGCSEAGCVAIHPDAVRPDAMGYSLPHVHISAGTEENPEEIVLTKGDQTIRTKDLGYMTKEGELRFVSRLDDMINVAGLNVYPQQVEDVLLAAPFVEAAVVYKKQDRFTGERVCTQLVAPADHEAQLREWCRQRLAPYQVPVEWTFVREIPTLPNGKISRKQLGGVTV